MAEFTHDLPEGVLEWVQGIGGGEVSRLERHVARREAWVVDVARPDGSTLEGFLRIDRSPVKRSNISLEKEARIVAALRDTPVPVPALHGWNETLQAALFARDPGRSDIDKLDDPKQQRAVMEDFVRIVARLHALDIDALGLDDVIPDRPTTAAECALGDVDAQLEQFAGFLAGYTDPLITYGVDWLRRYAPKEVARVALVQGDTGPVNFMFQGDRVSSSDRLGAGATTAIRWRTSATSACASSGIPVGWSRRALPSSTRASRGSPTTRFGGPVLPDPAERPRA